MKTVHSEVCGLSGAPTETFFLEIEVTLEFFNCNFSMLWGPQAQFQSPPLSWGVVTEILQQGISKLQHLKTKTICTVSRKKYVLLWFKNTDPLFSQELWFWSLVCKRPENKLHAFKQYSEFTQNSHTHNKYSYKYRTFKLYSPKSKHICRWVLLECTTRTNKYYWCDKLNALLARWLTCGMQSHCAATQSW